MQTKAKHREPKSQMQETGQSHVDKSVQVPCASFPEPPLEYLAVPTPSDANGKRRAGGFCIFCRHLVRYINFGPSPSACMPNRPSGFSSCPLPVIFRDAPSNERGELRAHNSQGRTTDAEGDQGTERPNTKPPRKRTNRATKHNELRETNNRECRTRLPFSVSRD